MTNSCPVKIPKVLRMCEACMYSKEGKCDFPYTKDMTEEDVKNVSKALKSFEEYKVK